MGKRVLIVGGVAGGASAAARLRRLDEEAEIILFERGEYISYANCGLPYHIGGVIKDREELLLVTPEEMQQKFRIDVRTRHEVVAIRRESRFVVVRDLVAEKSFVEPYDALVLAPGSSPLVPPIPGRESARVMTLWTVPDMDRIHAFIRERDARSAVVVGGGFIGIEMAENLHHRGLGVTLVEMLDQVMAPLDREMAELLHGHLEERGVELCLGDGVAAFRERTGDIAITLSSGREIIADLVILAIGVRANSTLAREAGLEVAESGGIVTDDCMRTSDPFIYAVGDAVQVRDFVTGDGAMIPLAGPANKQGRIAADNIAGGNARYTGTQGSCIVKVFDLSAAATGLNEKSLLRQGMKPGEDFRTLIITQNAHAGYYPGASPITLKMIFSADGGRILGAQAVGRAGVDKRIDTLAVAMRLGASATALKDLEMAYAPPFSSAKDPVNMAGFMAENILLGRADFVRWDALDSPAEDRVVLDVRDRGEYLAYALPDALHIPFGELRQRAGELDRGKEIVLICAVGIRAYNAARLLANLGFARVRIYPGGLAFYYATHHLKREKAASQFSTGVPDPIAVRADCVGLKCPALFARTDDSLRRLKEGEIAEVLADDTDFPDSIADWVLERGDSLVSLSRQDGAFTALIRKGKTGTESADGTDSLYAGAMTGPTETVGSEGGDEP